MSQGRSHILAPALEHAKCRREEQPALNRSRRVLFSSPDWRVCVCLNAPDTNITFSLFFPDWEKVSLEWEEQHLQESILFWCSKLQGILMQTTVVEVSQPSMYACGRISVGDPCQRLSCRKEVAYIVLMHLLPTGA